MPRLLKSILRAILSTLNVLFTGGRFGTSVRSNNYSEYKKSQERKRKDFAQFGGRKCKICGQGFRGTSITALLVLKNTLGSKVILPRKPELLNKYVL